MPRRGRAGTGAALLALCLIAVPPAGAAEDRRSGTGGADTAEELQEATEERHVAKVTLEELERRVRSAEQSLDRIDRVLDQRAAELASLEQDVAEAREVEAEAATRTHRASLSLDAAHRRLNAAVDGWEREQDELAQRAAQAYKHGGNVDGIFAAYLTASDLHDVATAQRALRVSAQESREQVHDAGAAAQEAIESRRVLAEARREHVLEQRAARDAREEAQQLVRRQERLLDDIAAQREEQATIIATFEQDQAHQQALLRELDRRIARLGSQLATELAGQYADGKWEGTPPAWASGLPAAGRAWGPRIAEAAAANAVDPRLLAAVVWTESYFNPAAVSHAGAIGLAQLMPGTAAGLGVDPWNPVENLHGGARYLKIQLDRFGRVDLALAAYNAGPNAVDRYGGIPPYAETQFYVLRVLGYYDRLVQLGT